ncbi:MAG: GntR family transcriptional regulator [Pseudomonadota bacterium]
MSLSQPLSRASLSQQIKDRLLSRITSGTLKPGDRLIELKIAAEMETSQAPVREALKELEAMGVIETLRNKGSRVRMITMDEMRQAYDVRAELEGFASALAATAEGEVSDRLSSCINNMREAAGDADLLAFADHDMEFHRTVVDHSGNAVLLEIWDALSVKMRVMRSVAGDRRDLRALAISHQDIVDAIASGDSDAARIAARRHVLESRPELDLQTNVTENET